MSITTIQHFTCDFCKNYLHEDAPRYASRDDKTHICGKCLASLAQRLTAYEGGFPCADQPGEISKLANSPIDWSLAPLNADGYIVQASEAHWVKNVDNVSTCVSLCEAPVFKKARGLKFDFYGHYAFRRGEQVAFIRGDVYAHLREQKEQSDQAEPTLKWK